MFALPNRLPIRAKRPHVGTDPVSVRYIHLSIHQDRINIRAEQGRKNLMRSADRIGMGIGQTVPTCGLTAEPHNISLTLLCLYIYAHSAYWPSGWDGGVYCYQFIICRRNGVSSSAIRSCCLRLGW